MPDILAWAKAVSEWIRSPKRVFIAWFVCGFALISRSIWWERLGVRAWFERWKPLFVLFFLVCTATLIVEGACAIGRRIRLRWELANLQADQMGVLLKYAGNCRSTLYFPADNGVVQDLARMGVLYRSSEIGSAEHGFAYSVTPAARRQVRKLLLRSLLE